MYTNDDLAWRIAMMAMLRRLIGEIGTNLTTDMDKFLSDFERAAINDLSIIPPSTGSAENDMVVREIAAATISNFLTGIQPPEHPKA